MIRPTRDNVLLSAIPPKPVSAGGIHLVEQYNDDRMQWIVDAVGPKVTEVVPGDRVLTPLYFDHVTLADGRKLVSQKQLIMRWNLA